jgi:hypothetical protein
MKLYIVYSSQAPAGGPVLFDERIFVPAGDVKPEAEDAKDYNAHEIVGGAFGEKHEIMQGIKFLAHGSYP